MSANATLIWNEVKKKLKQKFDQETYNDYIDQITEVYKETDNTIYLVVENMFNKTRVTNIFLADMNECLSEYYEEPHFFALISKEEIREKESEENKEKITFSKMNVSGLNPNYTFSTFVVGDSNRFAHRYATLAAEQLAGVANPVYLFGDVGLGKTHLMQAIGNYILESKPEYKVVYVRTQDFVEDYAKASKTGYDNFSEKYEKADVLLVDDVQFLENKTKTQIEFFKIFEKLTSDKKLIVLTSDRKASELKQIMVRLTSRFEWGISLDINKPSKEHRINILKVKLKQELPDPSIIPEDVIDYVATVCENNIRELESDLRRVLFYCDAFGYEFNLQNAQEALKNIVGVSNNSGSNIAQTNDIKKLIDLVATYFKISQDDLLSNSRKKDIVYARQLCWYIMRNNFDLTLQKIGDIFGGKDHSTVMHGIQVFEDEYNSSEEGKKNIENIVRKLGKSSNEI